MNDEPTKFPTDTRRRLADITPMSTSTLDALKTDVHKTLNDLDEQVRKLVEYAKTLKQMTEDIRRTVG